MINRRVFSAIIMAGAIMVTAPGMAMAGGDKDAVTVRMTAAQIENLLAGNTVMGTWSGSSYTQYYGEGDFTVYIPEGGEPDEGKWRANAETDEYESWWRSTGWTPYTIVMTNDGYAFVNGEDLEQFDVFEGKQVEY